MSKLLSSPARALLAGVAITALVLASWIAIEGGDAIGLASFLLRFLHVLSAMIWIGLVWFVNLVQARALAEADEAGRAVMTRTIVARVALHFRHASHATVLSGALLLVPTGYLLSGTLFSAPVFVPAAREMLLWLGVAGGLAMWAIVHLVIWPRLELALGRRPGKPDAKAAARASVALWARVNLMLMLPVTLAMVAAAHLY